MNDWMSQRLDQLGSVARGKSRHRPRNDPALYGGQWPFFQTGDIKAANHYLRKFSQTYNDVGLAQSKLWPAGTLCITIAANIAETAILAIPGCFPDSVVGFIADPAKADARFIKYYIEVLKREMQSASRGTTQDNLSVDKLLTFEFLVPSVGRQSEIASIVSAYDDLIENNSRRIAILEEIVRRIYEEWFVHFRFPGHEKVRMVDSEFGTIPQGWRPASFGDVVDNIRTSTPPGQHLCDRKYVPIDCIGRRSLSLPEFNSWREAQSSLVLFEKDDILFGAMRAYFHKVCLAPFAGVTRTTCFVLRPRRPLLKAFATLTACADTTVDYAAKHSQGATIPYAVWDGSLSRMKLTIPSDDLLLRFENTVSPMLDWIRDALLRQTILRNTRDLLLPKLISGEVDISAVPEPEASIAA